eukprot:GILJ01031603.1.p1 GENE.GILJ01031603.1~~GILJ01031603.1.p1  ORF type:complete len:121 (+),score=1.64 GILJ01031603.1:177-539(+)
MFVCAVITCVLLGVNMITFRTNKHTLSSAANLIFYYNELCGKERSCQTLFVPNILLIRFFYSNAQSNSPSEDTSTSRYSGLPAISHSMPSVKQSWLRATRTIFLASQRITLWPNLPQPTQ